MHYDDFIAQHVMKTKDPWSSQPVDSRPPTGRLLRNLWSGVRRLARGMQRQREPGGAGPLPPVRSSGARRRRAL